MNITKGEYCQFSLKGRLQLLLEFGEYLGAKIMDQLSIQLYRIYDFYVEVIYNQIQKKVEQAEVVSNTNLLGFYRTLIS